MILLFLSKVSHSLKGRDWPDMVDELKVQYGREFFLGLFETFLRCIVVYNSGGMNSFFNFFE